jgi:DNA-binding NtrC family response regulator
MGGMPEGSNERVRVEVEGGRCLISRSPALERVWSLVRRVAPADVSVLVTGETGTGKELVARLVHKLSARAAGQFVAVDCNAVTPTLLESELFGHERGAFTGADRQRIGVFELANGGTLFLDEIGNLPLEAQAKLLRVLQEREFRRIGGQRLVRTDFRLVTATNADLAAAVGAGAFRDDLYHRLAVVHLHLPPLRERPEDIPLLVGYLVNEKRHRLRRPGVSRVDQKAVDLLASYHWPGNVRELANVIETAILQCPGDTIEVAQLALKGPRVHAEPAPEECDLVFREARLRALGNFERLYVLAQLRRYHGSVKNAALHAEITSKHLRTLMRRHRIDRRAFRAPPRRARPPL